MVDVYHGSVHALAQAILDELAEAEDDPQHKAIDISYEVKRLRNGIKYCSVQVECKANCGCMVEATAEEADVLLLKAIAIQAMLQCPVREAPKSLSQIFFAVFPEFIIESELAVPKFTNKLLA